MSVEVYQVEPGDVTEGGAHWDSASVSYSSNPSPVLLPRSGLWTYPLPHFSLTLSDYLTPLPSWVFRERPSGRG